MTDITEAQVEAADHSKLIAEARELIAHCRTYNFGMWSADKLAHEVAGELVAALEAAQAAAPVVDVETIERAIQQVMDSGDWSVDGYASAAYEVMQGTWDFDELDECMKEEAERLNEGEKK